MLRSIALPVLVLLSAACGGAAPTAPAPTPTAAPTPAAVARYRVTFESSWSAETHPTEIPRTPHFSPMVGGTHRSTVRFWEVGGLAGEGIRLMAEQGRVSPLDTEVEAAVAAGHAQHVLRGGDIPRSPGSVTMEFEVGRDYPLVTLVSMLAPSPDWFVGVSALPLLADGDWVAEKVVVLQPHDAGTDSGSTYGSPDLKTVPPEPIHVITAGPLVVGTSVPPVGTFTFRRIS